LVKIRSKVILLTGAIFLILGAAEVLVERLVVMPSFAELERADARTAMRRIDYTLDRTLAELVVSATDWGNWADTYRFVQDHNQEFVAANITDLALRQLNVNLLLVVDRDGRFVQAHDLSLLSGRPLSLDLAARHALAADFPWRSNLREGIPARGLLQTNRGPMLLAAAPVLDGHGGGPVRGMVILGRLLSIPVVSAIGAQAQASLASLAPETGAPTERLVEDDTTTRVFRRLDDLYGTPIVSLRVDVPRRISARGQVAVAYASTCLLAAAVVVLILLVVVLNRVILRPLDAVTRHAEALGEDEDLTTRLNLRRKDEFGLLAREFDRMVDRVAESRTQLVDQSFEAGYAELAKGVLHNLGNAMTPIGVRIAHLSDRLRLAPTDDAAQAVGELQGNVADDQRRADLEQFLRLACQELVTAVRGAREDVAVISRQTTVIQSALAEQLRAARNQHVFEPVRLTELVAQSLEIVPDSCRQRLTVDTDETLRQLGVVRVARTVLRLILQNLIINAADAVRDAGKEKGTLRLRAEIVREADGQQLHLHCEDDGVGIAPQNLKRLFEKGYSTKSPETNHGIGLHWCANAIGALGGQIWAASDGPGRGASLHLLVPLVSRDNAPLAGAA
jgi:two-component system, NtrC family, sensor kinase